MMLSINLADSADSFIKTLNSNGEDSEVIFISSSNSLIRDLGERIRFWKRISNSDQFDQLVITPDTILQSINSVSDYLNSRFLNDSDITDITSRLTTEFYNSVAVFNDKKLADLMVVFLNHFAKIIYLLENSADAVLETNKEKVKNNLMMFPGISGANQENFACIEGTSVRIQEASLAFQKLPIDQQLYQDHVSDLVAKLINKKFPKSSVLSSNQIHIGAFIHSLLTLNHQDLDQFYQVSDPDISLYDLLQITREFKSMIKKRVDQLNQEIASNTDLSAQPFYQESVDNIESNSLVQYLETLKEKYGVELLIHNLMKEENDDNLSDDGLRIFKTKLKSPQEIKELFLQKLLEKFPQLSLVQDQTIEVLSQTSSRILDQTSQVSYQQDQFDFLAQLDIQKNIIDDRDLSIDPKKIDDILALLFPAEDDPNQSQKIKTGLMITHILARDLKNKDPIFFMALHQKIIDRINETLSDETSLLYMALHQKIIDRINETLSDETIQKITNLKDSFEHFSRSLSQSLTQKDQIGLGNLLAYLDDKYIGIQNYYFGDDLNTKSRFETYLKIYMSIKDDSLNLTDQESSTLQTNRQDFFKIAVLLDHKEVFDKINSHFFEEKNLLETPDALEYLLALSTSLGNRIAKELFTSTQEAEQGKLIDLIKSKDEDENTIFNYNNSRTNNDFFIDLLKFLKTYHGNPSESFITPGQLEQLQQYEDLIKYLFTTKNNQENNAIETAVDSENFSLFMIMLNALDQQQITEALADQNTFTAIANGINLCYQENQFDFIKSFMDKIFSNDSDNQLKIRLLLEKQFEDGNNLLHILLRDGEEQIIEVILSKVNDESKISLLTSKNDYDSIPLQFACYYGCIEVVEKLLAVLNNDQKFQLLKQANSDGFTALQLACENGHAKIVEKLLAGLKDDQKSVLLEQKTSDGLTPIELANEKKHDSVIKLLSGSIRPDEASSLDGRSTKRQRS